MSVADKITQLINDISSSYQKIQSKGGTIPSSKNTNNLPDAIDSIPIGSDPVITPIEITENGTYTAPDGVDGYSPITVNVPVGANWIEQDYLITEDLATSELHNFKWFFDNYIVPLAEANGFTRYAGMIVAENNQTSIAKAFIWLKVFYGNDLIAYNTNTYNYVDRYKRVSVEGGGTSWSAYDSFVYAGTTLKVYVMGVDYESLLS